MREVQDGAASAGLGRIQAWRYGAIPVALFVLDRALKWYVRQASPDSGWFSLSYHLNAQGPFSLPFPPALLLAAGVVAAALIVHLILRSWERGNPAVAFGLALMFVGGVSNLLDRLWRGGVADVFYFAGGLTFNLADAYLLIGVAVAWAASRRPGRP